LTRDDGNVEISFSFGDDESEASLNFGTVGDDVGSRASLSFGVAVWLNGDISWSSCGSDELSELHGSRARRSTDVEKSTALLELRARVVTRRSSGEEAEGGSIEGGSVEGGGGGIEGGGAEVGQSDSAKPNFTTIRVSRQRSYSPYGRSLE
jgi:hypothetical protein